MSNYSLITALTAAIHFQTALANQSLSQQFVPDTFTVLHTSKRETVFLCQFEQTLSLYPATVASGAACLTNHRWEFSICIPGRSSNQRQLLESLSGWGKNKEAPTQTWAAWRWEGRLNKSAASSDVKLTFRAAWPSPSAPHITQLV